MRAAPSDSASSGAAAALFASAASAAKADTPAAGSPTAAQHVAAARAAKIRDGRLAGEFALRRQHPDDFDEAKRRAEESLYAFEKSQKDDLLRLHRLMELDQQEQQRRGRGDKEGGEPGEAAAANEVLKSPYCWDASTTHAGAAVCGGGCKCQHLLEVLPDQLDLTFTKVKGAKSTAASAKESGGDKGGDAAASGSAGGWVISNPVHALHLASQLDNYQQPLSSSLALPSSAAAADSSSLSSKKDPNTEQIMYGEEQERLMALLTSGFPESWHPWIVRDYDGGGGNSGGPKRSVSSVSATADAASKGAAAKVTTPSSNSKGDSDSKEKESTVMESANSMVVQQQGPSVIESKTDQPGSSVPPVAVPAVVSSSSKVPLQASAVVQSALQLASTLKSETSTEGALASFSGGRAKTETTAADSGDNNRARMMDDPEIKKSTEPGVGIAAESGPKSAGPVLAIHPSITSTSAGVPFAAPSSAANPAPIVTSSSTPPLSMSMPVPVNTSSGVSKSCVASSTKPVARDPSGRPVTSKKNADSASMDTIETMGKPLLPPSATVASTKRTVAPPTGSSSPEKEVAVPGAPVPTARPSSNGLLSDSRFWGLCAQEEQIRILRQAMLSKRVPSRKKSAAAAGSGSNKKRKTAEAKTPTLAHLVAWKQHQQIPRQEQSARTALSPLEFELWKQRGESARKGADLWMEYYRESREVFWRVQKMVESARTRRGREMPIENPNEVLRSTVFGAIRQDDELAEDEDVKDFRCCLQCQRLSMQSSRKCKNVKYWSCNREVGRISGDDLFHCLECTYVGCGPSWAVSGEKSNDHIIQHMLVSNHKFGKHQFFWLSVD